MAARVLSGHLLIYFSISPPHNFIGRRAAQSMREPSSWSVREQRKVRARARILSLPANQKESIMNRRTTLALTSTAVLFLAAGLNTALPEIGLAQSNPLIGTWKLNVVKSSLAAARRQGAQP